MNKPGINWLHVVREQVRNRQSITTVLRPSTLSWAIDKDSQETKSAPKPAGEVLKWHCQLSWDILCEPTQAKPMYGRYANPLSMDSIIRKTRYWLVYFGLCYSPPVIRQSLLYVDKGVGTIAAQGAKASTLSLLWCFLALIWHIPVFCRREMSPFTCQTWACHG